MSDMKQNLLFLCAAALVLAACTKDEPTDDTRLPEGQYPLEIAAVTLSVEGGEAQPWGAPQTRVSENADGTGSVWDWDGSERIGVQLGGKTTTYILRPGQTLEQDGYPLYWTNTAPNQPVTAWYPDTDGTLDLRDQTNRLAYLLHGTGRGDYRTPVTLTFTHSLAKVRVTPSDAIGDNEVTSLQLYTYAQCTYKKGTDVQGTTEGWIEMKKCEYNGTTCWEANVVPGYEITKLRANGTEERTLSAAINPVAGSFYNITLNKKTYTASTADELMEWAEAVQTDPTLDITLNADITLTGEEWTPISDYAGTFDGNGKTITGLTFNQPSESNVGLFASIAEDGTVKNLTLEDVDITAAIYTGAVAGRNDGTIENCSVTGNVTGNALNNDGYVGGIVGENRGIITGCAAEGSVKSSGTYVGGIAGWHREGSITDCHSSATVTAMAWVGGIAGQSDVTITACYSTGDVIATKNSVGYSFAGGVVGLNINRAVLTACYATGEVKGTGDYVGGVVGDNVYSTVTACYHANGNVTGASGSTGGVVGRNYKDDYGSSTVTACYWDNNQSSGIGEDQTGKGETTKVTSGDWTAAKNAMNTALNGKGWKYVTGSGDAPLTLRKQ